MPAILRTLRSEAVLCLINLTEAEQVLSLDLSEFAGRKITDLLRNSDQRIVSKESETFTVQPYAFQWLKLVE